MAKHKEMTLASHVYATLLLGLLCGWYFLVLGLVPILFFLSLYYRSYLAGSLLAFLGALSFSPLNHSPNTRFMYSVWWGPLRDYFSFEYDVTTVKFEQGKKVGNHNNFSRDRC
jgi:hypothetical protein